MKNYLLLAIYLSFMLVVSPSELFAQQKVTRIGLTKAASPTTKGFIDKKSVFNVDALDSLRLCDDYVMLISSYDGCMPCEWLRTSDVFDTYPISPYYTDFLLNDMNQTVPYTFFVTGFPTCFFFDKKGEIVAVTSGVSNYGEKLEKIVKGKEPICEHKIDGISDELLLPFFNNSFSASKAYMKKEMSDVYKYATKAMEIYPNFYNKYLLYQYYLSQNNIEAANKYKASALDDAGRLDKIIYKKLIKELTGETDN